MASRWALLAIARAFNYVMLMAQLSKAQSCSNDATPAQRAWGWFEMLMLVMTLILVIIGILICIALLTMHRKITIHQSPQKRDAGSQAPCTYTRKNAQPRFVVLGEHSWG